MKYIIAGYTISTLLFIFYIQFSPHMGNIWWRNGYFSPIGAFKVMIYPFQNILMWQPEFWDINYPIWLLFSTLLIFLYLF
jgi:hypothetical protein